MVDDQTKGRQMAQTNQNAASVVAEICLYGNSRIGAGWLASVPGAAPLLGDGEPKAGRAFSEAVWLACDAIRAAGVVGGKVRIFAPGGERGAEADLNYP